MKTLKDYEYYKTDLGVLYCGDCLEILPLIPNNSVDLVLTDPPYGIDICNRSEMPNYGLSPKTQKKPTGEIWDKNKITKEQFDLINSFGKAIFWGANYYKEYFKSGNCYIVWDKRGDLPEVPFMDMELALCNFDGKAKKYKIINHGFIKDSKDIKTEHPTQKPSELFMYVLRDFSKNNQLIIDPFFGSGTTGLACEKLGRKWIGIEISEKYCAIAKKRIEQEARQIKMF